MSRGNNNKVSSSLLALAQIEAICYIERTNPERSVGFREIAEAMDEREFHLTFHEARGFEEATLLAKGNITLYFLFNSVYSLIFLK